MSGKGRTLVTAIGRGPVNGQMGSLYVAFNISAGDRFGDHSFHDGAAAGALLSEILIAGCILRANSVADRRRRLQSPLGHHVVYAHQGASSSR